MGLFEQIRARCHYLFASYRTLTIWVVLVLCGVLYVGVLFMGESSPSALFRLYSQKSTLIAQTMELEAKNATLQKQIFELQELKP